MDLKQVSMMLLLLISDTKEKICKEDAKSIEVFKPITKR